MQSRNSDTGVTYCTVETMSSDTDLVDITSVSVHRQMYDRCVANCLSDELADDYVYDDDDDYYDESPMAGGDNNASLTSVVSADVSNIPSTNGVSDIQSSLSSDKPAVPIASSKSMLQPPFGFPLRSQSEIMSHAMELIDSHTKHGSEDCGSNNNSFQHDNADCFKHAINHMNQHGDGDDIIPTAESVDTDGSVQAVTSTDTAAETLKQQSESVEVDVESNENELEAVSDLQTGFNSDETLHHFTAAAASIDNENILTMPAELKYGKAAPVTVRTECKQNTVALVMNGTLETDGDKNHNCFGPATDSDASLSLHEPNISSLTLSDRGASGDHCQQQPVSPSNYHAEPVSDAEFIAVVRRKRKDAGAKPKIQQHSDDFNSFCHRKPSRPPYTSPKSNIHHSVGRSSESQMQPPSQKSTNPAVSLWESTLSAFPALPSLRVRRNSTGDVPAASESNDDGSDLESVKSVQTSASRQKALGHSHGTSSYASVVVGNVSIKEPVSTNVNQSSSSILRKSPLPDGDMDLIPSHRHGSYPTFEEVAVHVPPVESASVLSSMPAVFVSSDFMVDSSIIEEDDPSTDDKVHRGIQTPSLSSTCPRASRRSRATLFFDTRSKSSSTPVPSLDISFGFDESVAAQAISSGNLVVTSDVQTVAVTSKIAQAANIEFLHQSSVARSSASLHTSTTSLQKSSFDLRAAQKYLQSAFQEVAQTRESDRQSVLMYGDDFN